MCFLYAHYYGKETKLSFSPVRTYLPENDSKPTHAQTHALDMCTTGKVKQCENVIVQCDGSALLVLFWTVVFAEPSPCEHRLPSLKGAW